MGAIRGEFLLVRPGFVQPDSANDGANHSRDHDGEPNPPCIQLFALRNREESAISPDYRIRTIPSWWMTPHIQSHTSTHRSALTHSIKGDQHQLHHKAHSTNKNHTIHLSFCLQLLLLQVNIFRFQFSTLDLFKINWVKDLQQRSMIRQLLGWFA